MILQILGCGTSTGVPLPACRCRVCRSPHPRNKRSRTAAVLKSPTANVLIDAGPDLRWQALQWDLRAIAAVLFTHGHADHILGLDDLRSFNIAQRSAIPCFAAAETRQAIAETFGYILKPHPSYEGGLLTSITWETIRPYETFSAGGIAISPFELRHGSQPVTGFRIGELAYATDCNAIPERSRDLLQGLKYLILDGLRFEAHRTHFTIPEAVAVAQSLGVAQTYLTHLSHAVDYEDVSAKLPSGIALAYDGLEIDFNAD